MVAYEEEWVFPAPKDVVWKLLDAHLDDATISVIHPLVRSQKTVRRTEEEIVFDRVIDVRGKLMDSRWKVTYHRPYSARWDIVGGKGPWAPGSYLENTYSDAPGGTSVRTRADMTISVLPFFMSQKRNVAKVLEGIDAQDMAFLRR